MAKKMGEANRGGSAHDRAVAKAKMAFNLPSPLMPPRENLPSLEPPKHPERKSAIERVFLAVENPIVLTVVGIVGGFMGIFVDGRYFLLLYIPLSLGIHRSKALEGIGRKGQIVIHGAVLLMSTSVFWWCGLRVNQSREHIPTPIEMFKRSVSDAVKEPLIPPQGSVKHPDQIKPVASDLPKVGFQDDSDQIEAVFGTNGGGMRLDFLKKSHRPMYPVTFEDFSPVMFVWDKDHVSYTVKFWSPDERSVIEVKDGRFTIRNPRLDRNFTKNAFEVVSQDGHPILQIIWETPSRMRINGLFPLPNGKLLCMADSFPTEIEMDHPEACQIKPIFKYPSWKNPGLYQN